MRVCSTKVPAGDLLDRENGGFESQADFFYLEDVGNQLHHVVFINKALLLSTAEAGGGTAE